jgi:hypothetical protein
LSKPEKLHTEKVCEEVKKATGGWPYFVDLLFELCRRETDPRPAAQNVMSLISDSSSDHVKDFIGAIGINQESEAWGIVNAIIKLEDEEIPQELLEEYISEDFPHLQTTWRNHLEYLRRFGIIETSADIIIMDPIIRNIFESNVS